MKQFFDTYVGNEKLSALLAEFPASTRGVFKDSYVFEFLELPENHKENDLRRGLVVSHSMIAEYETKLINKSLLQKKMQEMTLALDDLDDIGEDQLLA